MTKPVTRKLAVDCLLDRVIAQTANPLRCPICQEPLLPGQQIQFDHTHADIHGGPHDYRNLRPVHYDPCHKKKTNADTQAKAKGDRILGLTCNGPKAKIPARAFPKCQRKIAGRPFQRAGRQGFTDGKRRVATEQECAVKWGGAGPGVRFRCNLCGHKFAVGDGWRWQYVGPLRNYGMELLVDGKSCGVCNFFVCDACDGPDVIARWVERHREFYSDRFWAIRH